MEGLYIVVVLYHLAPGWISGERGGEGGEGRREEERGGEGR